MMLGNLSLETHVVNKISLEKAGNQNPKIRNSYFIIGIDCKGEKKQKINTISRYIKTRDVSYYTVKFFPILLRREASTFFF